MAFVKAPLHAFSRAALGFSGEKSLQLDVRSSSRDTLSRLPNIFLGECTKRFSGYVLPSDMRFSPPDRLQTLLRPCWDLSGKLFKGRRYHVRSNRIQDGVFSRQLVLCCSLEAAEGQSSNDGERGQMTYSGTIIESTECEYSAYKEDPVALGNNVETATFGMGCFWSPDALYGAVPGVVRTRVGYSGGSSRNPSYEDMGNHTECVQIEYDPGVVSFGDILKVFWKNHDPTTRGFVSQQYASLVLVHTSEQLQLVKADIERLQNLTPKKIRTRVEVAKKFFLAEGYHQKFSLRNHPDLLPILFPNGIEWRTYIDSPMTSRINGLLASANGKVSLDGVNAIFGEFNVPLSAQEYIMDVILKRKRML